MANKKIVIEYDINGKPIDVAIDKTLNLQQQVRELTKELRKTKEGSAEFQVLSRRLGEAQDGLAKTTAKSKDLFSSLSMLPGPVGSFFASLQNAIDLLKVFSSFSLKDIQFQFRETIDDVAEIAGNFTGLNREQEKVSKSSQSVADDTKKVSSAVEDASQAFSNATANAAGLSSASKEIVKSNNSMVSAYGQIVTAQQLATEGAKKKAIATGEVTTATKGAIVATELQTVATNQLTLAQRAATYAATALRAVLASLGIGLLIAAISFLISKIIEWTSSTEEADDANKALNETLKEQERLLQNDMMAIDLATKAAITRAQIAGKSEQEIYEITKNAGRDRLQLLRDYDNQLYADQKEATNNTKLTHEMRMKLLEDINAKILKNGQDITKQILSNEQERLDFQLKIGQKYRDDTAAGLEKLRQLRNENSVLSLKEERERALRELEIQSENEKVATSKLRIARDLRNKILEQIDIRYRLKKAETNKKFDEEEEKAFIAFLQKQEEIRTNAIDDAEQREIEARENKLHFDKIAISKEKEFLKKSAEERAQILKNLETTAQMDIIKIREGFFLKRLQQEQDQFLKQQSVYTTGFENLAESARIGLQKEAAYQLLHQKTLKDFYAARFVDLRGAYQMEYDEVNKRLEQDKLSLQKALEDKKLTQEQFAIQSIAINDRIAENNQKLFDRQRQLDQLEIDAKRAQTDMLVQIGNNLVGLLQAVAGKSKKLQVAAALTEAAVSIARVVVDTSRAIIAFSASVAPLGPVGVPMAAAYAVKAKIAAALAIGTIVAQGVNKLKEINTSDDTGTSAGGSGSPYNGLGRNYEKGGMIRGPRHAQGGVMIEAEGGEAIMTRGAVTMFAPLLSAINQIGGGTSFTKGATGQASFDNPMLANNVEQNPMIIKTYVVSQDMTSEAQKQARLKDLSTL
jgi:hypothetical protein